MISNERPSPFMARRAVRTKPHVEEFKLRSNQVSVERKIFTFTVSENARGRFLRITEDCAGHRNAIVIPATGLEDFRRLLAEMAKAADELPPETDLPARSSDPFGR
jgi:hypothetical protein